ncbi:hypothetical protein [Deinococcus aquaticus]|uniref:hypothetical protein n=1 Tax=Deinococcus aquaticus TaxID=328692 RepID=UPI003F48E5A9
MRDTTTGATTTHVAGRGPAQPTALPHVNGHHFTVNAGHVARHFIAVVRALSEDGTWLCDLPNSTRRGRFQAPDRDAAYRYDPIRPTVLRGIRFLQQA